jgi:hypothetical protein
VALIRLAAAFGCLAVVAGFALSPWPWVALVVAGALVVAATYLIAEERDR